MNFFKTQTEIEAWLKEYGITDYTILKNLRVNVKGDVNLINKNLNFIPVRFNQVSGYFDCSCNQLTSLKFAPKKVGGDFYCHHNQLKTLEFCPKETGVFSATHNELNTLVFFPQKVHTITLSHNPLLGEHQAQNFDKLYAIHKKIEAPTKEKALLSKKIKTITQPLAPSPLFKI